MGASLQSLVKQRRVPRRIAVAQECVPVIETTAHDFQKILHTAAAGANFLAVGRISRTTAVQHQTLLIGGGASCETDWVERHPAHAVAKWLGHSPKAAAEHYLMSREHHLEDIVNPQILSLEAVAFKVGRSRAAGWLPDSPSVLPVSCATVPFGARRPRFGVVLRPDACTRGRGRIDLKNRRVTAVPIIALRHLSRGEIATDL